MLQLKNYQTRVLDELKEFLINASLLKGERGIKLSYLDQLGDEASQYKPIEGLEASPFVCVKVPTGGGKTLIAAHSLDVIQTHYLQEKNGKGVVLWLVPSDAIRTQTLNSLKDQNHPYREALDKQFNNNIKVYTIEEALSITKADLTDNLCIIVSSLSAFRREDSGWLKVFQNNGSLISHFEDLVEVSDFLERDAAGEVIYSLANVISINSPIILVDEGHNAQTALSFDMLRKLNPSIVLEFTATPRRESNVLVKVLASELKAEKMVKIPIYLTNVTQWQEAIRDGVKQLNDLAELAKKEARLTKEYIRPIALLQAEQEKESATKIHVAKIKEFLIEDLGINEEEIAIKTAKTDEIKGTDLLSPKTKIKYIITVNALKEGWDCPFAYVLVSVANIGARIAVEQTMGRVLRLPNVVEKQNQDLNYSYVFASTENFSKASSAIIKGLESNGFSREDLRQFNGKTKAEKDEFDRQIPDDNIAVPFIAINPSNALLAFNRDLIGPDFKIYEHYKKFKFDHHADQNRKVKIDIDKENGIYKITQGKLALILHPEDFSTEELSSWLKRNVRHSVASGDEMSAYIDKALADLLKTHALEELSLNRFRLKEVIQEQVSKIIQEYAQNTFNRLQAEGKLHTNGEVFSLPEAISLNRPAGEYFQLHLFEKAGHLNGEETEFAFRLDGLENLDWWYRNREKEDFYLQGWKSNKFYPDFVAKTKSGKYILIEYKGEDRLSNEDTTWKNELGLLWQKLTKDKHRFYLVGKKDTDKIIKELSTL